MCERVLGGLDGRPAGPLTEPGRAALAHVPHAAQWANEFTRDIAITTSAFRHRAAPFTVHTAAEGIAQSCIPQPDEMLRDLLTGAIGEFAAHAAHDPRAGRGAAPAAASQPVNTTVAR